MARFVVPITIELHSETTSIDEAKENFYKWRKFVTGALRGRLAEVGVHRISIPPVREVIEVDAAWREEQLPVTPSSKRSLLWTHRVAIGPKPSAE